jgi:hypothetical protein
MITPPTDGLRAYYGADGRLYYRSSDPFVDGQAVGGICPPGLAIEAPLPANRRPFWRALWWGIAGCPGWWSRPDREAAWRFINGKQ